MGAVVEELDSSGQKTAGYVYGPGGELLATQTSESGTNVVTWKHLTSFGTGEYSINTQNSTVGRVEFDPLHANVSTTAPSNPPLLEGQGDVSPTHSGSNLSARFGDIFNTTAGCMIDGIPSTCDMAMSLRNRGAGDRVTKALVYNHGTRGIDWYGDVHEEGVAGFTFLEFRSATGGTMGGGYAPDTYSEVLGGTQNSSVTIYGGAALASTAVGAEQPQNAGRLSEAEHAILANDLNRHLLSRKDCIDFVRALLRTVAINTQRPAYDDVRDVLDKIREQGGVVVDADVGKEGHSGEAHGAISANNATMRVASISFAEGEVASAARGSLVLGETLHFAAKHGVFLDSELAWAGYQVAWAQGYNVKGPPKTNDREKNSDYFHNTLQFAACSPNQIKK
jgi:hypothetical protein